MTTKHLYRTLTWPEVRARAEQGAAIVIGVAAIRTWPRGKRAARFSSARSRT